jgi:hypothetical protein
MRIAPRHRAAVVSIVFVAALGAVPWASPQTGASPPRTLADALACGKAALGGAGVVNGVKTLRLAIDGHDVRSGEKTQTIDEALALPDKFMRRTTMVTLPRPGLPNPLIDGFAGQTVFAGMFANGTWSAMRSDDSSRVAFHQDFARYVLMWLLRTSPLVPVSLTFEGIEDRRAIVAATGDDGFNATLALDARTCVPVALTYTHPPNMGDILRLRGTGAAPPASITAGIELSNYRVTNGLSFPRTVRWLRDGQPIGEWRVIDLQVNPSLPSDLFSVP